MELIKPNFKFKVADNVILTSNHIQSLTLLYQPIIGSEAFSLYTTLATLPSKTPHAHHLLLQIFDFSMEQLIASRHRLEAAGLVDAYESDELLTYVLKKPLSIDKFFCDGVMSAFLYVKLGATDFAIMKQMLVSDREELEGTKISKRFDEVFDIKTLTRVPPNLVSPVYEEVRSGACLSVNFDQSTFASILLKKGISQEIISPDLLKILNEFAFLYKLDVHELARIVFDSLDPVGVVDYLKMKSLARTQFQLMSKGERVQVVVKDEKNEEFIETRVDKDRQAVITFLEQNPIDFLRFKSGGKPPVPADIRLVEWLYLDQEMNAGVVNVLVDYVLNYTDGKLPKHLVEKIAGEWQRQNISTVQAAMDKVLKQFEKNSDYKKEQKIPVTKKKAPVVEAIPEWFGKDNEQSKLNVEEAEAAKKRIEEMRSAFLKEMR
jgi:replication initiation and membrane attachment protein